MLNIEANTHRLTDRVIMMARGERQHSLAAVELERIKKYRAAKRLLNHARLRRASVVVKHVIGAQKQLNIGGAGQIEVLNLPRINDAEFGFDSVLANCTPIY